MTADPIPFGASEQYLASRARRLADSFTAIDDHLFHHWKKIDESKNTTYAYATTMARTIVANNLLRRAHSKTDLVFVIKFCEPMLEGMLNMCDHLKIGRPSLNCEEVAQ